MEGQADRLTGDQADGQVVGQAEEGTLNASQTLQNLEIFYTGMSFFSREYPARCNTLH